MSVNLPFLNSTGSMDVYLEVNSQGLQTLFPRFCAALAFFASLLCERSRAWDDPYTRPLSFARHVYFFRQK